MTTSPRPLDLANARVELNGNYPMLRLDVEGRPVTLGCDPKRGVHISGAVSLGGDFFDILPPITIHPYDRDVTIGPGCTRDARLFALYDAFLTACADGSLVVGPIPIPDLD